MALEWGGAFVDFGDADVAVVATDSRGTRRFQGSSAKMEKFVGRLLRGGPFILRRRSRSVRRCATLVLQRVDDGDVRFDLHGLAVENGGAITPLAHRIDGGSQEQRIAADHLQGLDRSVGGDDGS